jgi:hypothetical protein
LCAGLRLVVSLGFAAVYLVEQPSILIIIALTPTLLLDLLLLFLLLLVGVDCEVPIRQCHFWVKCL